MEFRQSLKFYLSRELADKAARTAEAFQPDVVQIERSVMAPYIERLSPAARAKSILVFHDAAAQQYGRIASVERDPLVRIRSLLYGRMMNRWEASYASRFRCCVAVSEADRRLLLNANPNLSIEVIPNGVDTRLLEPLPPMECSSDLVFVGSMGYAPNSDGAVWFCREVLPHIGRLAEGVDLWIVGARPTPAVAALAGSNIHITGRVEDIVPLYRRSSVVIVPLRAGGGTRLKILEAMALGRPVVSTSVGAEGLNLVPGEHLLIADDPKDFAKQVVSLLSDPQLRLKLTRAARRIVAERYDWDGIAASQVELYQRIADNGTT